MSGRKYKEKIMMEIISKRYFTGQFHKNKEINLETY